MHIAITPITLVLKHSSTNTHYSSFNWQQAGLQLLKHYANTFVYSTLTLIEPSPVTWTDQINGAALSLEFLNLSTW